VIASNRVVDVVFLFIMTDRAKGKTLDELCAVLDLSRDLAYAAVAQLKRLNKITAEPESVTSQRKIYKVKEVRA
jgi:uncharacterized phage protein gp47/JayE